MNVFYFLVSFLASIAGAICGIGGGVIIKPVLDMLGLASISTISFLSGCTVLSMSCYSVGNSILSNENTVDFKVSTPLAVGAAIGGVVGKQLFSFVMNLLSNQNSVGMIQSLCLMIITIGTFMYTIFKSKIRTYRIKPIGLCGIIGLVLGIISSFLGIGGGPINFVILFFFFSMDTKTSAQNSIYIILFSQITSLAATLVTKSVPEFHFTALILMILGGIGGGIAGKYLNKRMNNQDVDKIFLYLMGAIIFISVFNAVKYSAL